MRYVVALLASKYDIAFAEGEDRRAMEEDMVDRFTGIRGHRLRVLHSSASLALFTLNSQIQTHVVGT